ncbi:MAG: hypothetical protein LN545_03455 [Candidatus Megaira endosymbiont of Carteria cerasiformis]|nr:hypothetical protein [Candidatus Megaera polyxenophila]MCC8461031.1 hypothetical protein [Candidatus Megaera polyxenophila]
MFRKINSYIIKLVNKLKKVQKQASLEDLLLKRNSDAEKFSYFYELIDSSDAFRDHIKQLSIKDTLKFKKALKIFNFVGDNWLDNNKKPIVILWNFNKWKMGFVSDYLPEYRTVFIRGKYQIGWVLKPTLLKALSYLPERPEAYIIWGKKKKNILINLLTLFTKAKIYRMEDGFLRSFGSGLLHVTPYSIVLDKTGIYFDKNHPSDLENILTQPIDNALIKKAEIGIALMKAAKLTKYYNLTDQTEYHEFVPFKHTDRYSILVVGQIEDDASIIYGTQGKMSNNDMIKEVYRRHPKALIYYRPHPYVISNNRKKHSNSNALRDICVILDHKIPLHDVLLAVDHVYTITSLVGIEALIYGKKVTTLGLPFYAGWGLTDDVLTSGRRQLSLSLQELFAGAYLIYPRYYHPISAKSIDFIELACYFLIEKIMFMDLFTIPKDVIDLEILKPYKEKLSPPAQLLLYLIDIGVNTRLEPDIALGLIKNNFKLHDFRHFSLLLINSFNYDALASYINYCLSYVEENLKQLSLRDLEKFFWHLSAILVNYTSGRPIRNLPNLIGLVNDQYFLNTILNQNLVLYYIECLSKNIQYDLLENLVDIICKNANLSCLFLRKILIAFKQMIRTEQNSSKRSALILKLADHFKSTLNKFYHNGFDLDLNTALYNIALDNNVNVLKAYNRFLIQFENTTFDVFNAEKMSHFDKRRSCFVQIFSYLLGNGYYTEARNMIENIFTNSYDINLANLLWLRYYFVLTDTKNFLLKYNSLSASERKKGNYLHLYALFLRQQGHFREAKQILLQLINPHLKLRRIRHLQMEVQKLDFAIGASRILNSFPQPKMPKGVVFLATHVDYDTMGMAIPALLKLKERGYSVISLTDGMIDNSLTGLPHIDQFSNVISHITISETNNLENNWTINWENKVVMAEGINFYQGFYESLSTTTGNRSYFVDLNIPLIYIKFKLILKRSDLFLSACKKAFSELILREIPVIFITGFSSVTPSSVIRDYCLHKKHHLLSHINLCNGYEHYFSNLYSKFANTMCIYDITLYPNQRGAFLASKDKFEFWYEQNKGQPQFLEVAKSITNNIIKLNRADQTKNSEGYKLIQYLTEQKELGKKIVCVFGKIPIDLAVICNGGPAHEDLLDWLNHTLKICGEIENIILLIKPHPHEMSFQFTLEAKESFVDLIFTDIKSNVILLKDKEINTNILAPYLDLAILWNGSVCLELTVQGVPVIMCSYASMYDYPIDLVYPESRSQYEDYLIQGDFRHPDDDLRKKTAFLMLYMSTDEINLVNQYNLRTATNDLVGTARWCNEKIEHFLKFGDPHMDKAADRITEKFESNIQNSTKKQFCKKFEFTNR